MKVYDQRGGRRSNSGRHKVPDKKQQIYVMILTSRIKQLGMEKVKQIMSNAVEQAYAQAIKPGQVA